MDYMEFITEYSIWFIVGGIILFMTLIGYIADKYNYVENQKNKNKEKRDHLKAQNKSHITKNQEQFAKEIGNGKNLVLEECDIIYPIILDEENKNITLENTISPALETNSPIKDANVELEKKEMARNTDIETPLENGVLNLDAYDDASAEDDIWKF